MLRVELSKTICSVDMLGTFVVLAQIGFPLVSLLFVHLVPDGTMQSELHQ